MIIIALLTTLLLAIAAGTMMVAKIRELNEDIRGITKQLWNANQELYRIKKPRCPKCGRFVQRGETLYCTTCKHLFRIPGGIS
jgi:uncharacterized protein YbaR (Trm112 family)